MIATRFRTAFFQLSTTLQEALYPLLSQPDFAAKLTAQQVAEICQSSGITPQQLSVELVPLAATCARTPISNFNVGAIALGESGSLYFGANMEFIGAPLQQTIHAEQCAIVNAWLQGEERIDTITISHAPCGHCRQFMNELNVAKQLVIQLLAKKQTVSHPLFNYLPDSFGPSDLDIQARLMDRQDHGYCAQGEALFCAAIDAVNQSYAPYSHAYSGVALLSESGRIYAGRYAENAAFNPSLPPLQAALIMLNLAGENDLHINSAILAERKNYPISQWAATKATLAALGCHQVQLVHL